MSEFDHYIKIGQKTIPNNPKMRKIWKQLGEFAPVKKGCSSFYGYDIMIEMSKGLLPLLMNPDCSALRASAIFKNIQKPP